MKKYTNVKKDMNVKNIRILKSYANECFLRAYEFILKAYESIMDFDCIVEL